MINIKKMCGGNDLDNENMWFLMIQIMKMCGGNDLDNENVCW